MLYLLALWPEQGGKKKMSLRPFTRAFVQWFDGANLVDIVRAHPRADRDAVDLEFLIGGGGIVGYAAPHGVNAAAMLDGECWDHLYDEDVAAEQTLEGWACRLCPKDGRRSYGSIDELWCEHLLQPFATWIGGQLRPAEGVSYYARGAATWASLGPPDENAVAHRRLRATLPSAGGA